MDNYSKDRIDIKGLWVETNGGLGAAPPTSFWSMPMAWGVKGNHISQQEFLSFRTLTLTLTITIGYQ